MLGRWETPDRSCTCEYVLELLLLMHAVRGTVDGDEILLQACNSASGVCLVPSLANLVACNLILYENTI